MPIVPSNLGAAPVLPKDVVDEKWLLMAAATMHEMGRLVEPSHDPTISMPPSHARAAADQAYVEPNAPAERIDDRYPNLEQDRIDQQRELDRTKEMRELEEEFETDMFKLRRGRQP